VQQRLLCGNFKCTQDVLDYLSKVQGLNENRTSRHLDATAPVETRIEDLISALDACNAGIRFPRDHAVINFAEQSSTLKINGKCTKIGFIGIKGTTNTLGVEESSSENQFRSFGLVKFSSKTTLANS
jgi:hypothetical protein